jgi:hypothetical protein
VKLFEMIDTEGSVTVVTEGLAPCLALLVGEELAEIPEIAIRSRGGMVVFILSPWNSSNPCQQGVLICILYLKHNKNIEREREIPVDDDKVANTIVITKLFISRCAHLASRGDHLARL